MTYFQCLDKIERQLNCCFENCIIVVVFGKLRLVVGSLKGNHEMYFSRFPRIVRFHGFVPRLTVDLPRANHRATHD